MRCNACSFEFIQPDTGYTDCDYGVGTETKHIDICPVCGSDDIEMLPLCEVCGERHAAQGEGICDTCKERMTRIIDVIADGFDINKDVAERLLEAYAEEWGI